jgi:hypothetical protein
MEPRHSGLGIASFVISILAGTSIFVGIVVVAVMEATTPGGVDENSAEVIVVGAILIAGVGVDLVALGLGIGGLCQRSRKKLFALLGTVFSCAIAVGTVVLIVVGNQM